MARALHMNSFSNPCAHPVGFVSVHFFPRFAQSVDASLLPGAQATIPLSFLPELRELLLLVIQRTSHSYESRRRVLNSEALELEYAWSRNTALMPYLIPLFEVFSENP